MVDYNLCRFLQYFVKKTRKKKNEAEIGSPCVYLVGITGLWRTSYAPATVAIGVQAAARRLRYRNYGGTYCNEEAADYK